MPRLLLSSRSIVRSRSSSVFGMQSLGLPKPAAALGRAAEARLAYVKDVLNVSLFR